MMAPLPKVIHNRGQRIEAARPLSFVVIFRIGENRASEVCAPQISGTEICALQIGPVEPGAGQIRVVQVRPGEIGPTQVHVE